MAWYDAEAHFYEFGSHSNSNHGDQKSDLHFLKEL